MGENFDVLQYVNGLTKFKKQRVGNFNICVNNKKCVRNYSINYKDNVTGMEVIRIMGSLDNIGHKIIDYRCKIS